MERSSMEVVKALRWTERLSRTFTGLCSGSDVRTNTTDFFLVTTNDINYLHVSKKNIPRLLSFLNCVAVQSNHFYFSVDLVMLYTMWLLCKRFIQIDHYTEWAVYTKR